MQSLWIESFQAICEIVPCFLKAPSSVPLKNPGGGCFGPPALVWDRSRIQEDKTLVILKNWPINFSIQTVLSLNPCRGCSWFRGLSRDHGLWHGPVVTTTRGARDTGLSCATCHHQPVDLVSGLWSSYCTFNTPFPFSHCVGNTVLTKCKK